MKFSLQLLQFLCLSLPLFFFGPCCRDAMAGGDVIGDIKDIVGIISEVNKLLDTTACTNQANLSKTMNKLDQAVNQLQREVFSQASFNQFQKDPKYKKAVSHLMGGIRQSLRNALDAAEGAKSGAPPQQPDQGNTLGKNFENLKQRACSYKLTAPQQEFRILDSRVVTIQQAMNGETLPSSTGR